MRSCRGQDVAAPAITETRGRRRRRGGDRVDGDTRPSPRASLPVTAQPTPAPVPLSSPLSLTLSLSLYSLFGRSYIYVYIYLAHSLSGCCSCFACATLGYALYPRVRHDIERERDEKIDIRKALSFTSLESPQLSLSLISRTFK